MRFIMQAVRSREAMVEEIAAQIPGLEIVWDTKGKAIFTFLETLRAGGDDPVVHIEDDVILTSNFVEKVEAGIAAAQEEGAKFGLPDPLVQFFSMRKADVEIGSRWDRNYLMNQCFYYPPGYAKGILALFPSWHPKHADKRTNGGNDSLVCAYLRANKLRYWIHVPSLVQHRIAKSAIDPRRSSKRQSKTFEP